MYPFIFEYFLGTVDDSIVCDCVLRVRAHLQSQVLQLLHRVLPHLEPESHNVDRHEKRRCEAFTEATCDEGYHKVVPRHFLARLEPEQVVYVFVAIHLNHAVRRQE